MSGLFLSRLGIRIRQRTWLPAMLMLALVVLPTLGFAVPVHSDSGIAAHGGDASAFTAHGDGHAHTKICHHPDDSDADRTDSEPDGTKGSASNPSCQPCGLGAVALLHAMEVSSAAAVTLPAQGFAPASLVTHNPSPPIKPPRA